MTAVALTERNSYCEAVGVSPCCFRDSTRRTN